MNKHTVKELLAGSYFSKPVYFDESFVITSPEMPLSGELLEALANWNVKTVYSDGRPAEHYVLDHDRDIGIIGKSEEKKEAPPSQEDLEKIRQAETFYKSLEDYTKKLILSVFSKNELHYNRVADYVKHVVSYLRGDYRFVMRILKDLDYSDAKEHIISHSVRTAIIAIVIGNQLKLANHKLIELGISALLHELGMLLLPSSPYLAQRKLNSEERDLINTHPTLAYNKLKALGAPVAICSAVLEQQERENGSGYPNQLKGDKIGQYGKILAVAGTYEALISKRPHRDAKSSYAAMLQFIKNQGGLFDDNVILAMVLSLSVYPIGLHVLLSNNQRGQVVDVNQHDPQYPIVHIMDEFTADGKNRAIITSPNDIHILRPLTQNEIGA
ncbi:MAG: HD domain-containing protein [Spirochaetes bacterium]|nr:HD domain-containing protein [Spirochaetota bacterium]